MCGKDEQSVAGTRSIDAICLIDRLLQEIGGSDSVIPGAAKLPIPDRDRLLTAVYFNTYGSQIETTITCNACSSRFDLNFSLDEWVQDITTGQAGRTNGQKGDYPFKAPGGVEFRLATGEDEMAVMGMEPAMAEAELLKRCLPEGTREYNSNILQQAMQDIAPLVDAEFEAQCPECTENQIMHFNLQQYLLSSLLKEQKKLVMEVHQLARAYGWGLNEILNLPRSIRHSYVSMVESI